MSDGDDRALVKATLSRAKKAQQAVNAVSLPPSEVTPSVDQPVLPHSLFKSTRGYIEKIVFQINRSYQHTCYDACAVMIRRLTEVLIIEAYEHHEIAAKVRNSKGDYLHLSDLIDKALVENAWTLGRNTKKGLPKLKTIGDQSAHSRRYNARRQYIDGIIVDLRTVAEEFLYVAGLRS